MKKKQEKTNEEKAAESHFKVDQDDLKYTTEKQVKEEAPKEDILKNITEKRIKDENQVETIEFKGKRKPKKKRFKKGAKKTTTKYSKPAITLKSSGYELIITEKPQAALKIASALGETIQHTLNKVPYYEVDRNGKQIMVACAVGHLFTLRQNEKGTEVPVFDISWVPNYLARKRDFTKRYYDTILKLIKNAKSLTIATDYDIEGEVIGMNVMKYICNQEDASRMKFSTLTKDELNRSYDNKLKSLNWGHAIAGETRHYLDWFYGINLSRALMNAVKKTGKFRVMSIGRVQGPALNMVVQKERNILNFKPEKYWQVFITVDDGIKGLELRHNRDLFDKRELDKFNDLKGKKAMAETKKREMKLSPLPPFDLTTLQTEAYKFHGISPKSTLQIAQSLYLAGLISYPRTSSQKLPKEIGYDKILKKLVKEFKVEKFITRKTPFEGAKVDAAHPSIYPTGNKQILSGDEGKLYKLIAKRFLNLFCSDAILDNKTVNALVDGFKFSARGQVIREKGWLAVYPTKMKEEKIPDVDGEVEILDSRKEEKETQAPKRYSPASIISALEKRNLGTKATRSSILETLYDRGYVEGKSIKATDLGISLIETLEKYSPIIIDEALTREFENDMDHIMGKKSKEELLKEEDRIIERAKKTITLIGKDFEKNELKIGTELVDANFKVIEKQRVENQLIKCDKCGKGHLSITYSKKNRRSFVACNAYPDCKNTFSLPPNGVIKKTGKVCEDCSYPMLMRMNKSKKPWVFCWNPKCKTNEDWVKRREIKS